jgi:hypothetical protein
MPGIINGSAFAPRPINPGGNQQILNENATLRDQKAIADVHRQLPTAQDMQVSATNNIKDMQQFLKNRGYNIGVDGVRGPQTNAAVAAFHNHIAPQQFNARFRPQHPASGKFVPSKPAGSVGRNSFTPGIPDKQPGAGGGKTPNTGQAYSSPGAGQYDPLSLAQSDANAQYDPSIRDLTNQTNAAGAQNLANQKALQDYYTQMKNLISGQVNDTTDQGTQGSTDYASALGNAAQLFGGAQAPQVGTIANQGADALSAVNQSQKDYLNNMQPLLKAQGAQGAADLAGAYNQQNNSLHSQLQAQQQAKGQAFTTDYQQGLQNQQQLQQNQAALNDAKALLPYQLQSAKAQASVDATNAADAPGINQAKIDQSNSIIKKNMAEAQAALAKGATFGPGSKDRQTLIKSLGASMVNAQGTALIGNPVQAQQALYTQAVAYGLLNANGQEAKPGVASMLKAVLQNAFASNAQWRNAGWQWNGNTFVQTKKK